MPYDNKKSFSDESLKFRRLEKEAKYKLLIDFCKANNQTPRTYKRPEYERVLGQFLVNTKALAKRNPTEIEKWEHQCLKEIAEYEVYQRDPATRLKEIFKWTKKNEKTPSQSSRNEDEKKLGQSLNSIKLAEKKNRLTDKEQVILKQILQYRTNHQRTRDEKLGDVLEFCRKENRTPRQHVKNKYEKRLAEFLTTTKGLMKNSEFKLDKKSQKLFDVILKFAPPTRESRIKELYDFAEQEKRKPSTSSEDVYERKIAAYLSKMKTALKREQLPPSEAETVTEILSICQIKTREEKLNDLLQWVLKKDKIPSFTSKDVEEKRLAMFMNNIRQTQKNRPQSLTVAEKNMIKAINSCLTSKQTV